MYFVVQMKKTEPDESWHTLEEVVKRFPLSRLVVAVDEDVNPCDLEAVNMVMCQRMIPHRCCRIDKFDVMVFDPKSGEERPVELSCLLINTTIRRRYPPLSLPKKEFMDEALRIWQKEGLPELKLKEPWWGYTLGYWSPEDDENAILATKGEYYQTGEIYAQKRMPI